MYNDFYGFTAKPFHIMPDPQTLYMSARHKEALACLQYGVLGHMEMTLISGEIGTGKTTLLRQFLKEIPADVAVAHIYNTNLSPEQLLSLVAQEFGFASSWREKAQAIRAIQQGLAQLHARRLRPLLIIDDAQNLSYAAMEEVRWLSNLQDDQHMLLSIILVGQPELRAKLQTAAMTSLAQRIGVNYHLGPFTRQDTEAYIRHRLRAVGGAEDIFTAAAIDLIHTTSRGVPRTINVLCDNALVYGFADNRKTIDDATVRQVLKEIYPTGVWDIPLGESKFQPAAAPETIAAPAGADGARSPETPSGPTDLFSQVESLLDAIDRQSRLQTDELRRMLKIVLANERARHAQLESRYHKIKKMFDAATQPAPETPSEAAPAAASESRKQ